MGTNNGVTCDDRAPARLARDPKGHPMRLNSSTKMNVVRKEEKVQRLREFILRDIVKRQAPGKVSHSYQLVALSIDSPVAKALADLSLELTNAGITVEAIFARVDAHPGCDATCGFDTVTNCRRSTDPRLIDAHEQLVLGPSTVWIGDCMRRDPAKRDAYECYAENCGSQAAWARRSFDRMWSNSLPVTHIRALRFAGQKGGLPVPESGLAGAPEHGPVTAATRH